MIPRAYSQHFIVFVTYELLNKLTCYITVGWKGMPGASAVSVSFISHKRKLDVVK